MWETNTEAEKREFYRRVANELIEQNICPQCNKKHIIFMCGSECSVCRAWYEKRNVWLVRADWIRFWLRRRWTGFTWRFRKDKDSIPF